MATASTQQQPSLEYADYGGTIAVFHYFNNSNAVLYLANIIEERINEFDHYIVTDVDSRRVLLVADNWELVDSFLRERAEKFEARRAA